MNVLIALCVILWVVVQLNRTLVPFILEHVPEDRLPGFFLWLKKRRDARPVRSHAHSARSYERQREWHNSRVFEADAVEDDRCAACDSRVVERIEEGVYRCTECGHTGGTRYPEWFARKQREEAMSQSPERRQASAVGLLRDASLALTALEGNIDHALEMSRLDTSRALDDSILDDHGEAEKIHELYEIQEEIGKINNEIRQAGLLLDRDLSFLEVDADTTFMLGEDRNRWTRQEAEYVHRHERAVHERIEELALDVVAIKRAIARVISEIVSTPTPSSAPW